jgi:predicted aspartyl protease
LLSYSFFYPMKIYKLEKHGSLLMVRTRVVGPENLAYPKLLLDTGSAYTILSKEILYSIGCDPAYAKRTQRIITGSGYEIVPVVSVKKFNCFGKDVESFEMLAHTLPFGVYVDGLLGMDFLGRFDIEIRILRSEILIK